jgi:hypothetical protein
VLRGTASATFEASGMSAGRRETALVPALRCAVEKVAFRLRVKVLRLVQVGEG